METACWRKGVDRILRNLPCCSSLASFSFSSSPCLCYPSKEHTALRFAQIYPEVTLGSVFPLLHPCTCSFRNSVTSAFEGYFICTCPVFPLVPPVIIYLNRQLVWSEELNWRWVKHTSKCVCDVVSRDCSLRGIQLTNELIP